MFEATTATLVAVLLTAAPADDAAARASEAWSAGDFEAAAEAFAEAYDQDPRREFLWGQAQALRRAEHCERAIEIYEAFIELGPPPLDVQSARTNITRCKAKLAAEAPEPEPEPEPEPPPPRPVEPTPDPVRDQPRSRVDPLGTALVSAGGATAIGASVLLGIAKQRYDRGVGSPTEIGYERDVTAARNLNIAGIACLAVGGALVVGGIVRFVVSGRRGDERSSSGHGLAVRF